MKLYFSGIASSIEAQMLQRAGITADHMLADPVDWSHVPLPADWEDERTPAMDSGAYRAWKDGKPIEDIHEWCVQVQKLVYMTNKRSENWGIEFLTMPDVLGDPYATWQRWEHLREKLDGNDRFWCEHLVSIHMHLIPVWQWGGDPAHLDAMCEWAAGRKRLVAIGGCVPWMRERNEENLALLIELAEKFGSLFHVLGLNWLEAIEKLDPLVHSCDTSKWLDGARYGTVIHDRNGHLVQEEKRYCVAGSDRQSLCVESAATLHHWVNLGERGIEPEPVKPKRVYTLKPAEESKTINPFGTLQYFATAALVNRQAYRNRA